MINCVVYGGHIAFLGQWNLGIYDGLGTYLERVDTKLLKDVGGEMCQSKDKETDVIMILRVLLGEW